MAENSKGNTGEASVRTLIFKSDGAILVSNARPVEDDYSSYYNQGSHSLIEPPYNMQILEERVEQNNTLDPCIDAMVTNIDGTGYEIERRDGEKMEDADLEASKPATEFFDECCPLMSFRTLRMRMRRELESTGNGFLEVIRNAADEIVFVGPLEAKMMRMARLDGPTIRDVTMVRGGKEITLKRQVRERRFAQKVGEKLVWFKEFGASRDLNKFTGLWAEQGEKLPYDQRATEVLHFGIRPDIRTPYFVPRWIGQTPSVLSSRKAEENNLEFFNIGGVPPYLVVVQGGQLAENTVQALRDALNSRDAHSRIQVIEAFSTSGELGSNGNVQVKVERFGGERTNDPMYQDFDDQCESRIRKAFRLPEILVGKTESMNFATAHASYLVAEAQVFRPERDAFDEIISNTLLPNILGTRDYVYRSKPISIVDASTQLEVIGKAMASGQIDNEQAVTLLGEIGGVEFKFVDKGGLKDVSRNFGKDPSGNVIPIETAQKQIEKGELREGLKSLLGCTLAVMAEQDAAG